MSVKSLVHSRPRARALLLGTSAIAVLLGASSAARAQANVQTLDPITVLATKTEEKASESLSAVSTIRGEQLQQLQPGKVSDAFMGTPGVWFQERSDDPGTAINIRGLQDFGRVAVVIDGARQNFQRTGHNADGVFYLEPELIGGADVVRGPVANVYGSGAIGGVVSFRTKDVEDVLRPDQKWGILTHGEIGSNQTQGLGSIFAAARVSPNAEVMFGGTTRSKSNYEDAKGNEIPNTAYDTWTGIAKATIRPADGHEVKFGYIHYDTDFTTGQPNATNTVSQYATGVRNDIATLRYTYSKPEDRWLDFDANVYWTQTVTDQTKTVGTGSVISGFIGNSRTFSLDTVGFDVHNTTRFDTGPVRHALTYGVDGFQDEVETSGFGVIFTPSGKRTVSGGFIQLKSQYGNLIEVIGAARYDRYELDSTGVSAGAEGDRLSPKITVGITPIAGITPYVTYAEGYRAPSTTETLISGIHPVPGAMFEFLPNPGLRPETGKNAELGLNLKFDNVISKGDGFRAKFNVFRNNVDDYIEQVALNTAVVGQGGVVCLNATPGPDCIQYQNIAKAELRGTEFESTYDAGTWFLGLAGSHIRGGNTVTGQPLARIAPDQLTTTAGLRLLDRKLTLAVRWQAVAEKQRQDIPLASAAGVPQPAFPPTDAYHLVHFHAGYQFNPDVLATFSVENLLNEQYSKYLTSYPNPVSSGAPIAFPQAGVTFKAGLQVRFGEDFYKQGSVL